jgi:hypothetical protein
MSFRPRSRKSTVIGRQGGLDVSRPGRSSRGRHALEGPDYGRGAEHDRKYRKQVWETKEAAAPDAHIQPLVHFMPHRLAQTGGFNGHQSLSIHLYSHSGRDKEATKMFVHLEGRRANRVRRPSLIFGLRRSTLGRVMASRSPTSSTDPAVSPPHPWCRGPRQDRSEHQNAFRRAVQS